VNPNDSNADSKEVAGIGADPKGGSFIFERRTELPFEREKNEWLQN
jgi:hypothetical protein